MPLREAKSPNSSTGYRPADLPRIKRASVYQGYSGPSASKPSGPPRGSAPGELIDGQITVEKSK
jgi:hypothetical protein